MFRETTTTDGDVDLGEQSQGIPGSILRMFRVITVHPNLKPWLNAEVCALRRTRDSAFRSGDPTTLRVARRKVTAGIKRAENNYALKIQDYYFTTTPGARGVLRGCILSLLLYTTLTHECYVVLYNL